MAATWTWDIRAFPWLTLQRKRSTIFTMKTAILPQVRVEPELRAAAESVLREGESLSTFVEATVRSAIEYRHAQAAFHARGEAAWQEFQRTGKSLPANQVVGELREMLDDKRRQLQARAVSSK